MANEPLKVSSENESFFVASQIERAFHWTMIREPTMNAIESASKASGDKIVHRTSGTYKGVRKAVIWNTGSGMGEMQIRQART